jgi:diguanylate cyclase (GGDEF)-like protein/putative nucleotidyltransferase with HDIG domain
VLQEGRAYWLGIVIAGLSLAAFALALWRPTAPELARLELYLLAAVATSGLAMARRPARPSTSLSSPSMSYVFIIAGLSDFHLGGGIVISIATVLGEAFFERRKQPCWKDLLFDISQVSLAVGAANVCLLHAPLPSIDPYGMFPIAGASVAYYLVSSLVLSGRIGFSCSQPLIAVWRESFLWIAPQYLIGGVIAQRFRLLVAWIGPVGALTTVPLVYLAYRFYSSYFDRVEEQKSHIGEMADLHLRTIEALALAIGAKDDTTSAHLRRVQVYASEVGKELGLSPLELKAIEAAALLHDIGKLAVPEYIVSKPGRLTPDEFEKMKIHPVVGAEILERVNFPYPVVPIVRAHHEKFDGTGYPDGLKGEEIPIGARILSAVDCLDALASERQYRKALPLEDAMRVVTSESGRSYDPRVVSILQARYRELELKAKAEIADAVTLTSLTPAGCAITPAPGFPVNSSQPAPDGNFRMSISGARREFQMLVEIANDLGSSLSLDETLALLAVRLGKAIPHDAVVVWVRHQNELIPRHVKGESYRLFSSLRIPLGQGLSGWVAENNQAIVNGNPAVESGYLNDESKVTPLRSAIAVPLICREQVVGVLTLYRLPADAFTADHRRILGSISAKVGVVIDNAQRFEQVQDAARTDELTGLLNSRSLFEYLSEEVVACSQRKSPMAVLVMDLDGFKKANDDHGHLAGNRILQGVAAGLRKSCRATDVVARLGGDEFVVVLPDPGECLPSMIERIHEVGQRAGALIGCNTSLSVGCAVYPDDATDAESLLERADERMYEEKRRRMALHAVPSQQVIAFPREWARESGQRAVAGQI